MSTSHRKAPSLWTATIAVALKELVTSFRDRQTTLYNVVLPLVLYPCLFWCLIQGSMLAQGRREQALAHADLALRAQPEMSLSPSVVLAADRPDAGGGRRERRAEATTARLEPFVREPARNIAADRDVGAYVMSFLLPILLVVITVMGAFFPAVDLTAGERERNTAETTMLLPIPRLAVHQGKVVAVCAAAVIATVLNMLALTLSAGHLQSLIAPDQPVRFHVSLQALLAMAPLAFLFAFFVSAVLCAVASKARTFKEGQALLGPVQILFVFPAFAAAMPGIELSTSMTFVPVLNVALAFRALLRGEMLPLHYTLTALSLAACALAAIWLAVRALARESMPSAPGGSSGIGGKLASFGARGP